MVLQMTGAPGNTLYYLRVAAANPNGPNNTGNYFLGVDFSTMPTPVPQLTSGSVSATSPTSAAFTLTVNEDLIGHFVLSTTSTTATTASVQMTIYDASGNVVYTLAAMAGDTRSLTGFLPAGVYTIRFTAVAPSGATAPTMSYKLFGIDISDPISPYPVSTSTQDSTTTSGSTSGSTTTGSGSSATW
jgi:hypothetical protein